MAFSDDWGAAKEKAWDAHWEPVGKTFLSRKVIAYWDINQYGKYVLVSSHTEGQWYAAAVYEIPFYERVR